MLPIPKRMAGAAIGNSTLRDLEPGGRTAARARSRAPARAPRGTDATASRRPRRRHKAVAQVLRAPNSMRCPRLAKRSVASALPTTGIAGAQRRRYPPRASHRRRAERARRSPSANDAHAEEARQPARSVLGPEALGATESLRAISWRARRFRLAGPRTARAPQSANSDRAATLVGDGLAGPSRNWICHVQRRSRRRTR